MTNRLSKQPSPLRRVRYWVQMLDSEGQAVQTGEFIAASSVDAISRAKKLWNYRTGYSWTVQRMV